MSRKRLTMDDLKEASATVQKRNPGLFGAVEPQNVQTRDVECKSRLDGLNKTERRFYDEILKGVDKKSVIVQPSRLFELQGGGTYTPDFLVIADGKAFAIEIKGGYRGPGWEQGYERYKRAAAQWNGDCFRFCMWTWERKKFKWDCEYWK